MKDVLHEILSELHHILSIASPQDLRSASNLASVSENMKNALDALARERAESTQTPTSKRTKSPLKTKPKLPTGKESRQRQLVLSANSNGGEESFFRLLMGSTRCRDKATLRRTTEELGIDVQIRGKDGKERAARKAARAIQAMPEERRARIVSVLTATQVEQTEGWISVIKGAR